MVDTGQMMKCWRERVYPLIWVTELIKTYTFDSTLTDGIVVTNITIVSTVYDDTTWCYVSYRSNHILDYSN